MINVFRQRLRLRYVLLSCVATISAILFSSSALAISGGPEHDPAYNWPSQSAAWQGCQAYLAWYVSVSNTPIGDQQCAVSAFNPSDGSGNILIIGHGGAAGNGFAFIGHSCPASGSDYGTWYLPSYHPSSWDACPMGCSVHYVPDEMSASGSSWTIGHGHYTGSSCDSRVVASSQGTPPLPPRPPDSPNPCGGLSCYDPNTDQYCAQSSGGVQVCVPAHDSGQPGGSCGSGGGIAVCGGPRTEPPPAPPNPPVTNPTNQQQGVDNYDQGAPDGSGGAPNPVVVIVYGPTGGVSSGAGGDPSGGTQSGGSAAPGDPTNNLQPGQICMGNTVVTQSVDAYGNPSYTQVIGTRSDGTTGPVPCNSSTGKTSSECPSGKVKTASGCNGAFTDGDCNTSPPTPPTCTGDAVLCGNVYETWRVRCGVEKSSQPSSGSTAPAPPYDTDANADTSGVVQDSDAGDPSSELDSSGYGYSTTCPFSSVSYSFGGVTGTLDFSFVCEFGPWFRGFILLLAALKCAQIISSGRSSQGVT